VTEYPFTGLDWQLDPNEVQRALGIATHGANVGATRDAVGDLCVDACNLTPNVALSSRSGHMDGMVMFTIHKRFLQYAGNLLNRR
jgi:hypothetical protein